MLQVSLKLYHHLKEVEKQMDTEENEKENVISQTF